MKYLVEEKAALYRAEPLDNFLVFKADYQKFQFSRHAHEDFALGFMERGIQKFHCKGEDCFAAPGNLITVNAGEVHDGMSADGASYHYNILYIPTDVMQKVGREMVSKEKQHFFRHPVTVDPELGGGLRELFSLLRKKNIGSLEVQSLFYTLLAC